MHVYCVYALARIHKNIVLQQGSPSEAGKDARDVREIDGMGKASPRL